MPTRHLLLSLTTLTILMIAAPGCRTTTLQTTWRDPSAQALEFRKVAAVVLNSSPAERRAQEDTLAANIKRATVVPSYLSVSDELLKDVPKAKQLIVAGGFDGALILKLVDTRSETTYVPPSASTWNDGWASGYSAYSYADSHPSYDVTPGYTTTDTFVRAEISLYSVPEGKLLWSGASETLNPADARGFAQDVLKAAGRELKKQGVIR
jgi:hypothetical protein